MSETFNNHTFSVCAYKESKYLEECIKSLMIQTIKSNIVIATSTPNEYIYNIAKKYNLEVFVNPDKKGIGHDWNFAVKSSKTDFVTVAHQDDIYSKNYTEEIKKQIEKIPDIVMLFTNHKEIRNRGSCKNELQFKN